jgi:hypothetical protein
MHVTINYNDGSEGNVMTHPRHLEDLKKVIGDMVTSDANASSFLFVVAPNPRGEQHVEE